MGAEVGWWANDSAGTKLSNHGQGAETASPEIRGGRLVSETQAETTENARFQPVAGDQAASETLSETNQIRPDSQPVNPLSRGCGYIDPSRTRRAFSDQDGSVDSQFSQPQSEPNHATFLSRPPERW